jgi:pyridoxal phosphate enzyme (YggS family)
MSNILANIKEVQQRISAAAQKAGRDPSEITLVAVTKTIPVEQIKEAIATGITDIGENRIQEAKPKIEQLKSNTSQVISHKSQVTYHLVGHLQTNKVKLAIELFNLIHSVDSLHLAEAISKRCREINKVMPVLLEVNVSGETSKFGIPPEKLLEILDKIAILPNIQVEGLMTIAPFSEDPENARPHFRKLKKLFEEIKQKQIQNIEMKYLSMGMTDDFEVAIEEGANVVRIGRAIFGERES